MSSGVISIWAQNQVENWSAFAPDFTELDENVEYNERESEFDEEDEDKSIPPKEEEIYQDIEVDIEKVDRIEAFCSSDEGDEGTLHPFLMILTSYLKMAIVSFCRSRRKLTTRKKTRSFLPRT